jgi:hypothetical protein
VGRAGVGVDNVDVPAASARGVLVLNSPTGNVVSAVEHTFAVLLALMRRVPEASASMAAGKWEKAKFLGSELAGKTVGIVGLGQVGSRVASRARAFEARLLGHDPYLPLEKAQEMASGPCRRDPLLAQLTSVAHSTATDKGRPPLGTAEIADEARSGAVERARESGPRRAVRGAGGGRSRAPRSTFDPSRQTAGPAAAAPERRRDAAPGRVDGRGAGASRSTVEAPLEARRRAPCAGGQPAARGPARRARRLMRRPSARRTSLPYGCDRLAARGRNLGPPEDPLRPVAVAAAAALETQTPETVNHVNAIYGSDRGPVSDATRMPAPRAGCAILKGSGPAAPDGGRDDFAVAMCGSAVGWPPARVPA